VSRFERRFGRSAAARAPAAVLAAQAWAGTLESLVRSVPFALVVAGVLLLAHVAWGDDAYPTEARILAAGIGIVAFAVMRGARRDRIPYLALAAGQFYLHFGIPTFRDQALNGLSGPIYLSPDARTNAVVAGLIALGAILVGAQIGRRVGARLRAAAARMVPAGEIAPRIGPIRIFAAIAGLLYLTIQLRPYAFPAGLAYVVVLASSPALSQTLLYSVWQSTLRRSDRVVFLGFTAAVALAGLMSGMLFNTLVPILVAVVLSWQSGRRFAVRGVSFLVVAYFILNPAKHAFRTEVWSPSYGTSDDITLSQRLGLWSNAVEHSWTGDQSSQNVDKGVERVSSLVYVAHTMEWVPRHIPHAGIARWWPILYSYVPRFLWKEKPDLTRVFNADYTITFDLQSETGTRSTTFSVSQMSDSYWSFGWPGVVLAGLLIGLLLGVYERVFDPKNWALWSVGMLFFVRVNAHGHLAAFYTGILQTLVVGFAILWLIDIASRLGKGRQIV
jgi:hypothetical protein